MIKSENVTDLLLNKLNDIKINEGYEIDESDNEMSRYDTDASTTSDENSNDDISVFED